MIESWLEGSLGIGTVLYLKHFEILEVKVIEDTSLKPCRLGLCPVTCSAHGNWLAYKTQGANFDTTWHSSRSAADDIRL
jgi:hypothetical protein